MDFKLKEDLKNSYNQTAKLRDTTEVEQWKIKEMNQFIQLLNTDEKCEILDLGAGPGRQSAYFANEGLQVTAIDLSPEMIKICKGKGLDAKVMDFYDLQFPEQTFHAVWSMNTLLHVPKKSLQLVLTNVDNVLKDEGLFYLGTYGGFDSEGVWEDDSYTPKRFFSFYEETVLKEIVSSIFTIVSFNRVSIAGEGPDYFGMIVGKK